MSLNKDLSQRLTIFVEAEQYSEEQKNPELLNLKAPEIIVILLCKMLY